MLLSNYATILTVERPAILHDTCDRRYHLHYWTPVGLVSRRWSLRSYSRDFLYVIVFVNQLISAEFLISHLVILLLQKYIPCL